MLMHFKCCGATLIICLLFNSLSGESFLKSHIHSLFVHLRLTTQSDRMAKLLRTAARNENATGLLNYKTLKRNIHDVII